MDQIKFLEQDSLPLFKEEESIKRNYGEEKNALEDRKKGSGMLQGEGPCYY